jgi:xanthine dehydrogenase accessory factor
MPFPFDYQKLDDMMQKGQALALCTVVAAKGSTPRKLGAKMVVQDNGTAYGHIEGTVGGGAIEHLVRQKALVIISNGKPETIDVALSTELGMCCGGQMSVFIEPLITKPHLVILGAGHISKALSTLAVQMQFDVTVADPRTELLDRQDFSPKVQMIEDYSSYDLEKIRFTKNTFVIVVTHDHRQDQELVEKVLPKDFGFAALVGSKRKARLTVQRCLNKDFTIEQINRLVCPAGLDISAETPEEIALSIMAQMTQVHRQGRPLVFNSEIQICLQTSSKDSVA